MAGDSRIGGTGDITIKPGISGTGFALTKVGSNTLSLAGTNTYSGATTVSAGTLLISGTIANSTTVNVNTGTLNYTNGTAWGAGQTVNVNGGTFKNNGGNFGGTLAFNSGTVGGTNLSGVALSIGAGQTLSPGNSPGTINTGSETWANAGTYLWEINALATSAVPGSEGADPGWDFANIGGTLSITAGVNQFNLNVDSLLALNNWDNTGTYQWRIATASGGVLGFNANVFNINTSAFSDQNSIAGGTFSVSNVGNDIFLNYTAIPEPSTYAMLIGGLGLLAFLRRRSKS